MTLRKIALILVIAALIGSSAGVVTADAQEEEPGQELNGHCDEWDHGRCCDDDGRQRQRQPDKGGND
jgi:hypothetical protein